MSDEPMDVFTAVQRYADANNYVDVADKLPIFICSIGAHMNTNQFTHR